MAKGNMGSDARMSNNVMNQKGLISGWNVFDLVATVSISLLLCNLTWPHSHLLIHFLIVFLSMGGHRSYGDDNMIIKLLDKTKVQPDLRRYCHFKHLQLMRWKWQRWKKKAWKIIVISTALSANVLLSLGMIQTNKTWVLIYLFKFSQKKHAQLNRVAINGSTTDTFFFKSKRFERLKIWWFIFSN